MNSGSGLYQQASYHHCNNNKGIVSQHGPPMTPGIIVTQGGKYTHPSQHTRFIPCRDILSQYKGYWHVSLYHQFWLLSFIAYTSFYSTYHIKYITITQPLCHVGQYFTKYTFITNVSTRLSIGLHHYHHLFSCNNLSSSQAHILYNTLINIIIRGYPRTTSYIHVLIMKTYNVN